MKPSYFISCLLLAAALSITAKGQPGVAIGNGVHLLMGDSVRIVLQDIDLSNNGDITSTIASRFVFAGNGSVNGINGTAVISFGDIEIKRSAGRVQLNTPITVNGRLIFVSGNIDLNGNSISLADDPNGQLINENDNSRIAGNSGFVHKTTVLNTPVNTNPGNLGLFITSAQNPGSTSIERYHYSVNGQSVRRVYRVVAANNSGLDATLRFQYLDAELNGLDENQLTAHTSSIGTVWAGRGGTNNATTNTFTINGLNDLGWITLAYANAALPVVLSKFEIACTAGQNYLHWQTAQELNSDYFKIESSGDGLSWQAAGKLPAKGNSNTLSDYYYSAASAKYYRLQAVDKDGSFTYAHVLAAACRVNEAGTRLYPNPAKTFAILAIGKTTSGHVQVKLFNSSGQLIWQQQVLLQNNNGQVSIPLAGITAGLYYVYVQDDGGKQVFKLLKQ